MKDLVQQKVDAQATYVSGWHECFGASISFDLRSIQFIVPKSQPSLRQAILDMHDEAVIVELMSGKSIQTIMLNLKEARRTRLVFLSQSGWHKQRALDEDALFLALLKQLSDRDDFQLDIAVINTFSSMLHEETVNPFDAIYLGLGRTFAKEHPRAHICTFNISRFDRASLDLLLMHKFAINEISSIFIANQKSYVQKLTPVAEAFTKTQKGFKQKGCYLIIGGTGGIGRLLADYLSKQYSAQVILASRRPPSDVASLSEQGDVLYHPLDLTKQDSVAAVFEKFPAIDGVVHSALVLDDASILSMTEAQLQRVLAPKVQGCINLVNEIAHKSLDFVLFFSSIQSFIANAGQANYTAACLCKDAIAKMLANIHGKNVTIINWGYWGELGVVANDFYRERMQKIGVHSITADEGLAAIETFLRDEKQQFVYVKASHDALEQMGLQPAIGGAIAKPYLVQAPILSEINPDSPEIVHNKQAMEALNHYARCQFHQQKQPKKTLQKYQRLSQAVAAIPKPEALTQEALLSQYPELAGHVDLLNNCLKNFAAIVSGEVEPLSVLFPNGSFHLVEPVYRDNPVANYYNRQVAIAVNNVIDRIRQRSDRLIRVLEVGAGTGSTSDTVIPQLSDNNLEYVYTDISPIFLNQAKQKFKQYDFVNYALFDMEKGSDALGKFDVIFATNAVHATRHVSTCIKNFCNISQQGGVVILNEITDRQDFATLTFGLTEGWWLCEDALRIANSPLLSLDAWQRLLRQNGFEKTSHHGSYGQHVIVGELDDGQAKNNVSYAPDSAEVEVSMQAEGGVCHAEIKGWLKQLICEVMHLPVDELVDDIPFKDYGIDSLITLELLKPMHKKVGYVSATLLFEYPNLNLLANYFEENHAACFVATTPEAPVREAHDAAQIAHQDSNEIMKTLRSVIAAVLYIAPEEVLEDMPFKDIGIDSLISLELITKMQAHFGYLPATTLFEFPTLKLLATHILASGLVPAPVAQQQKENQPEKLSFLNETPDQEASTDAIAIVGMAGQFPGANHCDALWTLLKSGEIATDVVPYERWKNECSDKSYTQIGGFIDDVDAFDHQFFKITPIDAERIDPGERLFLQNAYHAVEDAGYKLSELDGMEVGCYVGVMNHGYSLLTVKDAEQDSPSSLFWSIANRVSYQFNWTGPSFAIDSACSSSLTAMHTAVSALKNGDCQHALVGGVNLIVHPQQYDVLCQQHMLSADGVCRPFGKGANGFVDGEGVVAMLLMPFAAAKKENRRIYGVIRGSAVNAGGRANGYTAPNPNAQSKLIAKALQRAQLEPKDISYIEAHGTGTELGDPIEVAALAKVYQGVQIASVPIGSIKGNIGHLESAAGLASLMKVLLQMKYKMLLPSVNCNELNQHLNLSQTAFYINYQLKAWESARDQVHRACVSSFGAGGANAHIIVEQVRQADRAITKQSFYFFPLSGHSYAALQHCLWQLNERAQTLSQQDLYALSYAYCCQRDGYQYRAGFVVNSVDELKKVTEQSLQGLLMSSRLQSTPKNIENILNQFITTNRQDGRLAGTMIDAFNHGVDVDWPVLFDSASVTSMPNYPFDQHRHWVDAQESQFKTRQSMIKQHQIQNYCMAPAALTLSMILEDEAVVSVNNIVWKNFITDISDVALAVAHDQVQLMSHETGDCYSEGHTASIHASSQELISVPDMKSPKTLTRKDIYQLFKNLGYNYGPKYQTIHRAMVDEACVRSVIIVSEDWGYRLSPTLFDAALQSAILLELSEIDGEDGFTKVPFLTDRVEVFRLPERNEPVYCTCIQKDSSSVHRTIYDIDLSDVQGRCLMTIRGVVSVRVDASHFKVHQQNMLSGSMVEEVELN